MTYDFFADIRAAKTPTIFKVDKCGVGLCRTDKFVFPTTQPGPPPLMDTRQQNDEEKKKGNSRNPPGTELVPRKVN
jgi:hypothetical protein